MDFNDWLLCVQAEAREALEVLARTPRNAREDIIFRHEKLNRLLDKMDILEERLVKKSDEDVLLLGRQSQRSSDRH